MERKLNEVRLKWQFPCMLGDRFTVDVSLHEESDGRISCTWKSSPVASGCHVEEILFPRVTLPYPADGDFITGFWDMGRRRSPELRYAPGEEERIACESMQFSALLSPETGNFYMDHRDPDWNAKALDVAASEDGQHLTMAAVYYPPVPEEGQLEGVVIPYVSTLGRFAGGWFQAAEIYRRWGTQQIWNQRPAENPLAGIDLWVWNRGPSDAVIPQLAPLIEAARGKFQTALNWYWWHSNPYDTDYPNFWPPREGVEKFTAEVQKLRQQQIFVQTYVNGLCWDMDSPSWSEGGDESVVIRRDGTPKACVFNHYNHHRLAYMCGESPKFMKRLAVVVGRLREAGLSGQYLDMIGCGSVSPCWNKAHHHHKNGGHYDVEAFRKFLASVGSPDFPITTECANEPFMRETEGAVVCSSASAEKIGLPWEVLPLFSAVYHGKYALIGTYAIPDGIPPWDELWPPEDRWKTEKPWHRLYPDCFFFEFARGLVWGAQPMICNLRENFWSEEFAAEREFTLRGAEFHRQYRKFLCDGEMLDPAGFRCADHEVRFLQRMIFTKENECRELARTFPAILHSCWRAPDGEAALVLVNYTDAPQHWELGERSGTMAPRSFALEIISERGE